MGVAISSILEFILKDRDWHECKVNRTGSVAPGRGFEGCIQYPRTSDPVRMTWAMRRRCLWLKLSTLGPSTGMQVGACDG